MSIETRTQGAHQAAAAAEDGLQVIVAFLDEYQVFDDALEQVLARLDGLVGQYTEARNES